MGIIGRTVVRSGAPIRGGVYEEVTTAVRSFGAQHDDIVFANDFTS